MVISAKNVCRVFKVGDSEVHAIRNVSIDIESGEFLILIGPSGSGKSTLLYILAGLDTPTSGSVLLEGADLAKMDRDERCIIRRQKLGLIFQSFNLIPSLSAEDNVALPLSLAGMPTREAVALAREKIDLVGLNHRRSHLPNLLSGGEQQRIAIARALVINPRIIVADEPTGNLDSVNSKRIVQELTRMVDELGITLLMVTHDPQVAACAKRIIKLRDGMIEPAE